jgi:hypothetical protein
LIMSKYQLLPDYLGHPVDTVLKLGGTYPMSVPFDPANTEYREYLAWLAEGNEPLPANNAVTWDTIRAKRDQLIADSDWTMIPGATVDQAAWAAYRQVLRDLPQTYAATGPESVVWPAEPSTAGPNTTTVE